MRASKNDERPEEDSELVRSNGCPYKAGTWLSTLWELDDWCRKLESTNKRQRERFNTNEDF